MSSSGEPSRRRRAAEEAAMPGALSSRVVFKLIKMKLARAIAAMGLSKPTAESGSWASVSLRALRWNEIGYPSKLLVLRNGLQMAGIYTGE